MGHGANMRLLSHNPVFPITTSHDAVFVQHFMIILPDPALTKHHHIQSSSYSTVLKFSQLLKFQVFQMSLPPLPKLYHQLWQKGNNFLQILTFC